MIEVKDITKRFGAQIVLDHINLTMNQGEIWVILGQSGMGKSVLLKTMMGLLKPDSGTVTIDGTVISRLSERELLKVRRNMGYVFQEGALYDFMNVYENLAFPLKEHTKLSSAEIQNKVLEILDDLDLRGVERKFPSELSGGMKKRVALGRAIVSQVKVLFCDEPTSGLDPIRSRDISDLIARVSKKLNCTTIITSHDMPNSFRIADQIVLIHDGHIKISGKPKDLQTSSNELMQEFLVKSRGQ